MKRRDGGAFAIWRALVLAQLRESPGRLLVTVLAIALGVALGAAVYLVNSAALNEFGLATKRLVGESDVVVRGPRDGFPEALFVRLSQDPAVDLASPVLELEVALPGRRDHAQGARSRSLPARPTLQPALIGDIGGGAFRALSNPRSIFLSSSAAEELKLQARRCTARSRSAARSRRCTSLGILSESTYSQALGIDGYCLGAVDFQASRAPESHRSAGKTRQRCGRLPPSAHARAPGRRTRRSRRRSSATAPSP